MENTLTKTARFGMFGASLALSIACQPAEGSRLRGGTNVAGNNAASGSGGTVGTPAPSLGGTGGSGTNLNLGGDLSVGGAGAPRGNGTPEVCDRIDNDENGIIDDVDEGHDGVCDCLNVATIGQIGPWSNGGNIFVTWLNARSPQGAVALDDQVLTAELLAPFQVIVVLHVGTLGIVNGAVTTAAHHAFEAGEITAFQQWIEAGGGAMTTVGYSDDEPSELPNVNSLLAPLGLGYSTTRLNLDGYVQTWQAHPVTTGVSNIMTQNGVEPEGAGTTVATQGSAVALQVAEPGDGRMVVWGDEWITYDSEWQDVADQQVELFWLNILKWLSPPNECQVEIPVVQ